MRSLIVKNNETLLKVFTIIFIVLTLVSPLFAIGSIICSVKLKSMMKLMAIAI